MADNVGRTRHLTVAQNGDVVVAIGASRTRGGGVTEGGILVLRDTDGDGVADERNRFGGGAGDDVAFRGDFLYYSTNDAIMRYPWNAGSMEPAGEADTIVSGLPATRSHRSKSLAFGADGGLYVNIGSPSNVCSQSEGDTQPDPCPELETRAGIWRFDADRTGQKQSDGRRYATGLRNTVALASRPHDGRLYGVIHGRDQLGGWDMFDDQYNAENPWRWRAKQARWTDWPPVVPEPGGCGCRRGRRRRSCVPDDCRCLEIRRPNRAVRPVPTVRLYPGGTDPEQDKRWVIVSPPGSEGTNLLLARAASPEQEEFIGKQSGGRVFLFLQTEDFWRDYRAMQTAGITFVREPKEESYGTVAVFADLYGNLWDLFQPG